MLFVKMPSPNRIKSSRAYNHPEYRKNSAFIKALFGDYCVFHKRDCGNTHTHHNDRNKDNNSILNLPPVCSDGHKLIHLSNWKVDNFKELIVERLKFLVRCIEAGKSL